MMKNSTSACKKCNETNTNFITTLSQMKYELNKKYFHADSSILTVINDVCMQLDTIISNVTLSLKNVKIEFEEEYLDDSGSVNECKLNESISDVNVNIDDDPIDVKVDDENEYSGSDDDSKYNITEDNYSAGAGEIDDKKVTIKTEIKRKPRTKPRNPVKPWRRPKACKQCNNFVGTWRQILQHRIKVHDLQKPFKCDKCPMTFYHSYLLANHSKSLHREIIGKRPYICEICSKVLSSKHGLKTHKLMHTDERPYECDICSCMFKGKKDIAKHMKVHSNNRSIVCELCSKTFKQRESFRFHMNTHYGIKPNKCQLCDKAFLQKSKLDRHMLSHTGERPECCPMCGKRYTTRYAVKHHLRTVHKVEDVDKVFGRVLKDCEKYAKFIASTVAPQNSRMPLQQFAYDPSYCDGLVGAKFIPLDG